jgi:SpoVK/Ycf46/Vps4 family AAA+-type ATPase
MPHVIVLYGKGGVGKSSFPVHLAGLLNFDVWDFNIGASHSKWVGEGAERMRDSLQKISKSSHIIVRIDEYDRAIGATSASGQGMHEAHKQVESEFMNWLQNCQEENLFVKNNIFVVLTTNHKENITGPLLRSGRADLVIDIGDFDAKSMKETLKTTARRMANRGAKVLGFKTQADLQAAIDSLDLDAIAELATIKGFTVRDIENLVIEMSTHNYYFKKGEKGIEWNTGNFVKVLEYSKGSSLDSDTGELVLGDREFLAENKKETDGSCFKDGAKVFDKEEWTKVKGFEEI